MARKLGAATFSVVLTLVLGELGTRAFVRLPLDYVDEKTSCYRYDELLGWFPREGSACVHEAGFRMSIRHNPDGFRDPSRPRHSGDAIAVLGDSFVWGYDVAREDRFTDVMQAFLPDWSIYNLGVSGYGTDQEYLLLQEWFPRYAPKLVILVVHGNDSVDNRTNYRDNYYKPYFEAEEERLILRGVPVPTCYRYHLLRHPNLFRSHFARGLALLQSRLVQPRPVTVPDLKLELIAAMSRYLQEREAALWVVFTYAEAEPDERLALDRLGIPMLWVPEASKFPAYGQHWDPEGHRRVAARILERLYREGVIDDEDIDKYPATANRGR